MYIPFWAITYVFIAFVPLLLLLSFSYDSTTTSSTPWSYLIYFFVFGLFFLFSFLITSRSQKLKWSSVGGIFLIGAVIAIGAFLPYFLHASWSLGNLGIATFISVTIVIGLANILLFIFFNILLLLNTVNSSGTSNRNNEISIHWAWWSFFKSINIFTNYWLKDDLINFIVFDGGIYLIDFYRNEEMPESLTFKSIKEVDGDSNEELSVFEDDKIVKRNIKNIKKLSNDLNEFGNLPILTVYIFKSDSLPAINGDVPENVRIINYKKATRAISKLNENSEYEIPVKRIIESLRK